jgi:hypothetical protein
MSWLKWIGIGQQLLFGYRLPTMEGTWFPPTLFTGALIFFAQQHSTIVESPG